MMTRGRCPLRVRLQLRRHLESGHVRHLDVGEHHVGIGALREHQRFAAVMRARHHLDVGFDLEQRGKRAEDHALIFGDEDLDRHRVSRPAG